MIPGEASGHPPDETHFSWSKRFSPRVEFFPFLILEASVSSNQKHLTVVLCGSADAIVGRAVFAV